MIDELQKVAELLCKVREQSPDVETKVGASLLTPVGLKVKATGFNCFPTAGADYPTTKPDKYAYMIHAEASIVAQLGREGCLNHKMVVTHAPCGECVKLLIHAGVSEVWYFDSHLVLAETSLVMLRDAGVKVFSVRCRAEEFKGQKVWVEQET